MASTGRIISITLTLISMFAFKDIKAASLCPENYTLNESGLCIIIPTPEVIEEDDCTDIECPPSPVKCPSDSYLDQKQEPPNEDNVLNGTAASPTDDPFIKCCKPDQQAICRCLPCPLQMCDKDSTVNIVRTGQKSPGQCCDLYQCVKKQCFSNGLHHDLHSTWMVGTCLNCTCVDGAYPFCDNICNGSESEELLGKTRRFSDDDLYPESEYAGELDTADGPSGCIDNKTIYRNGHTWKPDVCTECLCENGKKQCIVSHCKLNCLNPRKVADECCPICDDDCHLVQCNNNCALGYVFDENNCQTCECISNVEGAKVNTSTSSSSDTNQTYTMVDVLNVSTTENTDKEISNKEQQSGSECFIWVIVVASVLVVVAAVGVFILYRYVKKCKIATNDKVFQPKYEQVAVFDNNPVISNKEKIYPDLVNKI